MDFTTVENVTIGFEPTSYTISEDGPLVGEVCVQISNLIGELECNLVVTFNALSNEKSGKLTKEVLNLCLHLAV